jgi:hypothetical protein
MAKNMNKVPAVLKPKASHSVKSLWRRAGRTRSLKSFARSQLAMGGAPAENAANWFHNKGANTRGPEQGIGRTNRIGKGKK